MHGQQKLSQEGYRTRDGHLIEWFGELLRDDGPVAVASRPEPQVLRPLVKAHANVARNTLPFDTHSWRLPNPRDRRRWWVQSLSAYQVPASAHATTPVVTWNPFTALSAAWDTLKSENRLIMFDLLDDWTHHYAFQSIDAQVKDAYARLFERADFVTANAEGTLELAHRFGRTDAQLILNGCDPERFRQESSASGPMTVGYVGKIGKRVDLDLVISTVRGLPEANFVFAGPILDSEYRQPLAQLNNVRLLGDVNYAGVPELLATFDVGWVPHNVGEFEVGGDVIKTYEYRAAGLPVLSTPITGAGQRNIDGVVALPAASHLAWLKDRLGTGPRVPREVSPIPDDVTWRYKAKGMLGQLLG
jgi:glycosyltransferase involved in cell wall biosynthesis